VDCFCIALYIKRQESEVISTQPQTHKLTKFTATYCVIGGVHTTRVTAHVRISSLRTQCERPFNVDLDFWTILKAHLLSLNRGAWFYLCAEDRLVLYSDSVSNAMKKLVTCDANFALSF